MTPSPLSVDFDAATAVISAFEGSNRWLRQVATPVVKRSCVEREPRGS